MGLLQSPPDGPAASIPASSIPFSRDRNEVMSDPECKHFNDFPFLAVGIFGLLVTENPTETGLRTLRDYWLNIIEVQGVICFRCRLIQSSNNVITNTEVFLLDLSVGS